MTIKLEKLSQEATADQTFPCQMKHQARERCTAALFLSCTHVLSSSIRKWSTKDPEQPKVEKDWTSVLWGERRGLKPFLNERNSELRLLLSCSVLQQPLNNVKGDQCHSAVLKDSSELGSYFSERDGSYFSRILLCKNRLNICTFLMQRLGIYI